MFHPETNERRLVGKKSAALENNPVIKWGESSALHISCVCVMLEFSLQKSIEK